MLEYGYRLVAICGWLLLTSVTWSETVQLSWATDIHLDACSSKTRDRFFKQLREEPTVGVLLTGDLSNAGKLLDHLHQLAAGVRKPVYFVLGNHDYYGSSIAKVRKTLTDKLVHDPQLHFLTNSEPIPLANDTLLVGDDGWSDGMAGDFANSSVELQDYVHIDDLKDLDRSELGHKLAELGAQSAARLSRKITEGLKAHPDTRQLIVLLHPPPVREAALHDGKQANDEWAPHFVHQQMGATLQRLAALYPAVDFTALCGHTHHAAHIDVTANLRVIVGAARYGAPRAQALLVF